MLPKSRLKQPISIRKYSSAGATLLLLSGLVAALVFSIYIPAHASAAGAVDVAAAGGPIYKYLIHQGTGGPIGCGDSLTPVYVGKRSGDTKKDIATAMRSYFATPKNSGGLYNPLSDSKLRVRRVEYIPANKNAQIFLGGKLVRPKTYCESARARASIWATAQQFPEVRHATIWMGSALLGDLLAPTERTYDQ